jgi:ABC-type molybdenum transport system ATPase subunit/photorepair protein PhrA
VGPGTFSTLSPNGTGRSALVKRHSREIVPVPKPGSVLRIFGRGMVNLRKLRGRIGLVSASAVMLSNCFGYEELAHDPTRDQRTVLVSLLSVCPQPDA